MPAHLARVGALAAFSGAPTLLIATLLHPLDADPNDPQAAFAEYAADPLWVVSHLGQFLGVVLLAVALLALADAANTEKARTWARIGLLGAAASVAAAAALQAVDGVALKAVVDRWAQATGEQQLRIFEAAFAVRQVEIGLASLLSLLFGLTLAAYGASQLLGAHAWKWLGWLGLIGGLGSAGAGIAQAYTGFSAAAMALSMGASSLTLLWVLLVGVFLWRLRGREGAA
ncbi:MAG TPA: hypothetical protein VFZ26_04995 [Gemmatimonadales bacterium]